MQLKVKLPEHLKTSLNIDSIVERLQSKGLYDSHLMNANEVGLALNHWFQYLVDAINEDPEWYIDSLSTKHFTKHLPEPFDYYEGESEDDEGDLENFEAF